VEKLQDELRDKERQYKIKEKHLERLREKEEREKNKLQFIIEEMERDTERLNNYIKQLDESLKRELKKNQMSTLDTGGIRRELNG
jgi:Na+/phosphate symporter